MSGPVPGPRAVSYDRIPYPSLSYSQTHPDSLATVATLLGMRPAPPGRCRVLELGCAVGGNLIPMAYGLPDSEFVGIERSARQVAEGQGAIAALGLRNVVLREMDILDVGGDLGQFDYVIAHGVYSWVPPRVQDKLLHICCQNLAPNGIAYVSYNTYPGWHMIQIVRDAMLYGTRDVAEPEERAGQAREMLSFLAGARPAGDDAYGSFLNMYVRVLDDKLDAVPGSNRSNALLLHDELEAHNTPVYFHEFAERAARHGLAYLGEACLSTMMGSSLPPAVAERLGQLARSVVDVEQYLDFIHNRTFRQTLLCHEGLTPGRTLRPGRVMELRAASRARLADSTPQAGQAVARFEGQGGAVLSTDHPVTKAAMLCLAEVWPRSMPFGDLLTMARRRLELPEPDSAGPDGDLDAEILATNLLTGLGYSDSLVELHLHGPAFALSPGERPVASPVARLQAESTNRVTNLCHQRVRLDEMDRRLLSQLDGGHDRAALVDDLLAGPVAAGVLTLERAGNSAEEGGTMRALLAKEVDKRLSWLARAALLVA